MSHFDRAIEELKDEFGSDVLMQLTSAGVQKVPCVSTGSLVIDKMIGIGGMPYGRLIELFGQESSGKTTLAWQTGANCQNDKSLNGGLGGRILMLDYEQSTSLTYLKALGVSLDTDRLIICQPNCIEQGNKVMKKLIMSGGINFLIWDSIAAGATEQELSADYEMSKMDPGYQARVISPIIKRMVPLVKEHNVCAICINQIRSQIAMRGGPALPETTPGGRALKFYASLRMELRKTGTVKGKQISPLTGKQTEGPVSMKVRVTVVKNKMAPPFLSAEQIMTFGYGFDNLFSLFATAKQIKDCPLRVTDQGWVQLNDVTIGRGLKAVREKVQADPGLLILMQQAVMGDGTIESFLKEEVAMEVDSLMRDEDEVEETTMPIRPAYEAPRQERNETPDLPEVEAGDTAAEVEL